MPHSCPHVLKEANFLPVLGINCCHSIKDAFVVATFPSTTTIPPSRRGHDLLLFSPFVPPENCGALCRQIRRPARECRWRHKSHTFAAGAKHRHHPLHGGLISHSDDQTDKLLINQPNFTSLLHPPSSTTIARCGRDS